MSATCVGSSNASNCFSNGSNNSNNAQFVHYFEHNWHCHNNNNGNSNNIIINNINNNSSNISFINHGINTSHLGYNTNNVVKPQAHTIQHQLHTQTTTHIPSSADEIDEYFSYADEKQQDLTKEEREVYGAREMKGYQKLKLLGK